MKTSRKFISAVLAGMMIAGTFSAASISVGATETTNEIVVSSNLTTPQTLTYDSDDDQIKVTYMLKSDYKIVNQQSVLNYDSSVLQLASTNTQTTCLPVLSSGSMFNSSLTNMIKFNSSNLDLYDFSTSKTFFTATFDIVGSGSTEVDLDVKILTGTKATDSSDVTSANDVNLVDYDLSTGEIIKNDGFTFTQSATLIEASSDVKYSDFQLRGNITLALHETSYSANVLTGTVDLPAGAYKFVVQDTANNIAYGRAASYTDSISKGFFGNGWGYCTLNTTGGKYTFTFNKNNKQVNVTCDSSIQSNLSTYKLRGSINSALVNTSNSNIIKNTVALPAGDYRFVLTDDNTGISYGRQETFSGSIGRALCGNNWGYVEFTAETTGVYEFIYNTATNQVTVLPVTSNSSDYALVGSNIGFNFDNTTTTNVITKTVNLKAGTYSFGVTNDDGASYIGRASTYTDSITNAVCGKGWGLVTLNVTKDGNYKFTFNTKTNCITVAAV